MEALHPGDPASLASVSRGRRLALVAAYALAAVASLALILAAWQDWLVLPLNQTEVLAFVTGAWSVWFAARNNAWTWPIGVLNSAFFVVLFWESRLCFDMSLNVFYVVTSLWGWWVWLFGGERHTEKPVERVSRREIVAVCLAGLLLTAAMWHGGLLIDDAAPFLDALTTGLSVIAQWLLMRRLIEHWYFWIAADLVYVPLYVWRDLPLTAVLYAIFLLMCLRGLVEWRAILRRQAEGVAA
jgi:nicotinamide mononucleotide transporter